MADEFGRLSAVEAEGNFRRLADALREGDSRAGRRTFMLRIPFGSEPEKFTMLSARGGAEAAVEHVRLIQRNIMEQGRDLNFAQWSTRRDERGDLHVVAEVGTPPAPEPSWPTFTRLDQSCEGPVQINPANVAHVQDDTDRGCIIVTNAQLSVWVAESRAEVIAAMQRSER